MRTIYRLFQFKIINTKKKNLQIITRIHSYCIFTLIFKWPKKKQEEENKMCIINNS